MKRVSWLMVVILGICLTVMPMNTDAASYGWGYKKGTNHEPPEVGKYANILEKYGGYYLDKSGDKVIYLTFDNGYEQGYTGDILNVLNEYQIPATFFVTGHYVESSEELVKRMVKDGHIVGNHTYYHPDLTTISKEEMKKELDKLEKAVANITSQKSMKYVRPPKGAFSDQSLQWLNEFGYIPMFWSLAFVDWNINDQKGWQKSYNSVIQQIHPGAVILLHTVSKDNADALEHLITDLRKQGYTFKSLDDLVLKDILPPSIFGM
ncbi:delta-lactam-biosynthetic de-N-acetylase [Radiobacillus sp. PE A8.2]|uniref:delta-lactam-biosynthetic de-N-acetylase n=1 Tax=Radiobacillus sp. PE A8.2 TaxID=3380349 RepID=UPI00388DE199